MQKSNVEIEVLVNGKPVREYHQNGVFIEGRKGTQFSLRLRNKSSSRKLFIPSIDGLSVLDGENASYDSGGYVVNAYSSITIDGWRTSNTHVAQFYFSSPNDSYGKRTGKGRNLGIIGCAVYDEKVNPFFGNLHATFTGFNRQEPNIFTMPVNDNILRCMSQSSVNTALCSASLGTGWGNEKYSAVSTVEFEKSGTPTLLEIQYNTRENLQKMGIRFTKEVQIAPQSFPNQFCKPPRH